MSILSDNLRQLRAEKGLSLAQVAEKINKSVSVFNNYENGTSQPSINTLLDLCYLFNVTPNDLLGFTGISNNQSSDTATRKNDIGDYIQSELGLKIIEGETTSIIGNGYLYRGSISIQKIYDTVYLLRDKHKHELVRELINELKAWSYDNLKKGRGKVISVNNDELLSLIEAITQQHQSNNNQ